MVKRYLPQTDQSYHCYCHCAIHCCALVEWVAFAFLLALLSRHHFCAIFSLATCCFIATAPSILPAFDIDFTSLTDLGFAVALSHSTRIRYFETLRAAGAVHWRQHRSR
ncbi:hypothetical protein F5Y17DRAFT_432345 [Xylariaceae sp. FL0594]|nr:hypothetical protein F5Y17DRAFT_432345 [Xylariaceae sp. FL0594]